MDSGRIWSQSVARRSIVGTERTHNPTPAAFSILKRKFGAKRTRRTIASLGKRRRRFHRGNPAPAVIASLLGGDIPVLGALFKKRSDKIAREVAPAVVASANSGNLTAARGLMERAAWPMNPKEHDVWVAAAAQLAPKIVAAVRRYADLIPQASQRNPKEFVASLTPAVSLGDIEEQAREQAAMTKAERAAAAREARAERTQLLSTAADVGVAGLQALAGRGRRPRTRRRRRRTTGRRLSF